MKRAKDEGGEWGPLGRGLDGKKDEDVKWAVSTISESCFIIGGKPAPKGIDAYSETGIPFIKMKDLGNYHTTNNLIKIENRVSEETANKNRLNLIRKGAILLPRSGSVALNHRAILGVDAYMVSHICALDIKDKDMLTSEFLYYYLRRIKFENITKKTTGLDAITFEDLGKIKIPLPPIDEQKRIAEVLTRAENLIAKRKESIALLDEYIKSTFLEMFGDPVRNEKGWEIGRSIDYADCIVPGRDKPKNFTGEIPWVITNDLNHLGYTNNSKNAIGLTSEEILQVNARIIPKNSVIITCVGDLGISSIAGQDMVVNQQLHTFQCKKNINNIFFMHAISRQSQYMYLNATKTTLPYMNKTVCNSIPMIIPPLSLQNQFAAIVEKVESLKEKYKQSLAELEMLYGSLSQRAFRGEL